MIYAEFYNWSTGWDDKAMDFTGERKLIPACGSNAVYRLDGRCRLYTNVEIARRVCRQRGYLGFAIHRGESYSRSREIRKLEVL